MYMLHIVLIQKRGTPQGTWQAWQVYKLFRSLYADASRLLRSGCCDNNSSRLWCKTSRSDCRYSISLGVGTQTQTGARQSEPLFLETSENPQYMSRTQTQTDSAFTWEGQAKTGAQ